jgi:hypothetical protein
MKSSQEAAYEFGTDPLRPHGWMNTETNNSSM